MNQQYDTRNQFTPGQKKPFSVDKIIDLFIKFMPFVSAALCGIAAIALVYNVIRGFVSLIQGAGFGTFMSFLASAVTSLAIYVFYAAVCAALYKIATGRGRCRKEKESEPEPVSKPEPELPPKMVFCTQCGTRYDANKGGCPNGCKQ